MDDASRQEEETPNQEEDSLRQNGVPNLWEQVQEEDQKRLKQVKDEKSRQRKSRVASHQEETPNQEEDSLRQNGVPNLWEQVQEEDQKRLKQVKDEKSRQRKSRLKRKMEEEAKAAGVPMMTPNANAAAAAGVPPSPAQAHAMVANMQKLTGETIKGRNEGQAKLIARQDKIDEKNDKDLKACHELTEGYLQQVMHWPTPAGSLAGSGTSTPLSTDSKKKSRTRDATTPAGRANLLGRLEMVQEGVETGDEEEAIVNAETNGNMDRVRLMVGTPDLSKFVEMGEEAKALLANAKDLTAVLAIKDCLVALVDKKIHVLGTFYKGSVLFSPSFKPSPTALVVPNSEFVAGATALDGELVVWTDKGNAFSYEYGGNAKFGEATQLDFGGKQMASVGIISPGSYYGFDQDMHDPNSQAKVHFVSDEMTSLSLPKRRVNCFAASGNLLCPIVAHDRTTGADKKKGEKLGSAFLYGVRGVGGGDGGELKLIKGTIPNGCVGQTAANKEHVYVLLDTGDENHGKICISESEKESSKLSFGYNDSAPAMTQIAVADDFVLGLCEVKESVYRFDASLERPKEVAFSVISGNESILRIITMGASNDLAFFIFAEVDDDAKLPAKKKMKMTTPATGSTD